MSCIPFITILRNLQPKTEGRCDNINNGKLRVAKIEGTFGGI